MHNHIRYIHINNLSSISASPPPPPPPQFDDEEEEPMPLMEEDPYAATGPDLLSTDWIPAEYLEKGK